jgi:sialic acid synthase SpsE
MMAQRVHIIGEAGTNHGGSLDTGKRLVDVARNSGCDSVKFQLIYPEELYVGRLWDGATLTDNPVVEQRKKGMLCDDDFLSLASYACESEMPFSASVFGPKSLAVLDKVDPPYIKIASCDLNNHRLLAIAAETGRRIIVSTGFSTLGDIEAAVSVLGARSTGDVILLHCVSVYPAPVERMNLGFIDTLQTAFGLPVGLSDHSESSLAAAIAVSKGVRWIEKHFTLDRNAEGFDHAYAMEPDMMAAYIADVRAAEAATARPSSKLSEQEDQVRERARRGLYAARDMEEGEVLTEADVLCVRPQGQIPADKFFDVVGTRIRRSIQRHQPLTWDMFGG